MVFLVIGSWVQDGNHLENSIPSLMSSAVHFTKKFCIIIVCHLNLSDCLRGELNPAELFPLGWIQEQVKIEGRNLGVSTFL